MPSWEDPGPDSPPWGWDSEPRKSPEEYAREEREAKVSLQKAYEKVKLLHSLKAVASPSEERLLDEIMDDVSFLEADAVRNGEPPLWKRMHNAGR